jgi:hypothetical protein
MKTTIYKGIEITQLISGNYLPLYGSKYFIIYISNINCG